MLDPAYAKGFQDYNLVLLFLSLHFPTTILDINLCSVSVLTYE
jgi:hypothetical protein